MYMLIFRRPTTVKCRYKFVHFAIVKERISYYVAITLLEFTNL